MATRFFYKTNPCFAATAPRCAAFASACSFSADLACVVGMDTAVVLVSIFSLALALALRLCGLILCGTILMGCALILAVLPVLIEKTAYAWSGRKQG